MDSARHNLKRSMTILAWLGCAITSQAWSHGTKHGIHDASGPYPVVQQAFGIAGNSKKLSRTIFLDMDDTMRFSPSEIKVKEGDTIRFMLRNKGAMPHEWALGTEQELNALAAATKKAPGQKPNEVHIVHVQSGEMEEAVWNFNRPGIFKFSCLMSGHYEAGMIGTVIVKPAN